MMDAKMIAKLEERGGERRTEGTTDRLYFDAEDLGLELDCDEAGAAKFFEKRLSGSDVQRYKAAKTYVDLATGEVHSDCDELADTLRMLIDAVQYVLADEARAARINEPTITVQELLDL